jgi:hypothetical protein
MMALEFSIEIYEGFYDFISLAAHDEINAFNPVPTQFAPKPKAPVNFIGGL